MAEYGERLEGVFTTLCGIERFPHSAYRRALRMNIILLHGSWHGAWCWHKVVPHLESQGHHVQVPDLPAHGRHWRIARGRTTLSAMASHVCSVLDTLAEPALLVAHSRGGIVASTVAEMRPHKLHGVVYLAAYMLRNGERAADFLRKDKDSLVPRHIRVSKATLTDSLDEAGYRPALYADCSDADVALAQALLTAEPSLPALTRLRLSDQNYGAVRRHYIELTEDMAISLPLQRRMIAASPCTSVVSMAASHSAYFSQPEQLAALVHSMASS
jgi:pimeloyl-ACP methyl ester carboxylesterase